MRRVVHGLIFQLASFISPSGASDGVLRQSFFGSRFLLYIVEYQVDFVSRSTIYVHWRRMSGEFTPLWPMAHFTPTYNWRV